jgi:hypothetical protein
MRVRGPIGWAVVAVVLAFSFVSRPVAGDEEPPYAPHDAPVYLIVSFDDEFEVSAESESQTVVVRLGNFVGGPGIPDTRFAIDQALTTFPLPEGEFAPTFEELSDNEATVLGSFMTTELDEIHMVTPDPGAVPADVQFAVFHASNLGLIDALVAQNPFPTTAQIAEVIASQLPEGSPSDIDDVYEHVFDATITLNAGGGSAEGEGEMFPHRPQGNGLFHFEMAFREDGAFSWLLCLRVGIDIHPGSTKNPVNLKKKGVLPVAILSTDGFDATEVDPDTLYIGSVLVDKTSVEDVDCDGDDDLMCHWRVPDLVEAGMLRSNSVALSIRAYLEDGSCILGTDSVTIVPK